MSVGADQRKSHEGDGKHGHSNSHGLLNGPALCKPSTGKVGHKHEKRVDDENGMIDSCVKAPLFQYRLVEQGDPGIDQAEQ